ncbi:MAG TPA: DUF4388 domain-containing protein [Gemmatimonas sp.]|nr:DUF4388 domain-containing protein [Gemmatimonas sp.]
MSLEGRIRDLGLHEVCQLLGLSRKTGVLEVRAPLQGAAAEVAFLHGSITDAATWVIDTPRSARARSAHAAERHPAGDQAARTAVEGVVLEVLAWKDGDFRFVAADPGSTPTPLLRIPVEPVLVAAAQRAEVWERVADRIPSLRAVPAFVEVEPQQLSLLRLVPQEWEILTRVDGQRDLVELAAVLGRELLDIVETVHRLIGAGLLAIRDGGPAPRRHATPPSNAAVVDPADPNDLWIPGDDRDVVFDPVRTGVFTPEGLPRLRTPFAGALVVGGGARPPMTGPEPVASLRGDTSFQWAAEAPLAERKNPVWLCQRGDDAARRGDLAGALAYWSEALQFNALSSSGAGTVDAGRIREAMALATRLHSLLEPSTAGTGDSGRTRRTGDIASADSVAR